MADLITASLQKIANHPPAFVLRLHPLGGTWQKESRYNGSASITIYDTVGVIRGLHSEWWSEDMKESILAAVGRMGVVALIGTHNGRLWIWLTTQHTENGNGL